jgi:hypothetical protein
MVALTGRWEPKGIANKLALLFILGILSGCRDDLDAGSDRPITPTPDPATLPMSREESLPLFGQTAGLGAIDRSGSRKHEHLQSLTASRMLRRPGVP